MTKRGGFFKEIEGRPGGFVAKSHPLPPPSTRNRGGEGEPLRRPIPAARNRGEKGEEEEVV